MKITTILCLISFTLSSTVFVSCDEKRKRRSSGSSSHASTVSIDTADSLTDEMIIQMNRLIDTLGTVSDKDTATEAGEQVNLIADDVEALAKRFEALDAPSPEEKNRLKEKMKKAEQELDEKMEKAGSQLFENEELTKILDPVMKEFSQRMKKLEPVFEKFGIK